MRYPVTFSLVASLALLPALALSGCNEKKPASTSSTTSTKADDHGRDHGHDDGHSHDHDHGAGAIDIGTTTVGPFSVKATRDKGEVVAGKNAAFDVVITPTEGSVTKVAAARFWIGTEDAKGSVKAKAEIETPSEPNRWHTHAEVPSPMPAGSKFWFEIEDDKGGKHVGSFDLKN